MKKQRILIVSEYVVSTENSTGYYWSKIIHGLSLNFQDIFVICPEPSLIVANKEHDQNVKYIYVRKIAHNKNRLMSRLYGQIVQSYLFFYVLFRNIRVGDIIFSGTNPAPSLVMISLLKIVRPFSWLLLVHDVFPENLVAAQVIRKNSIIYGFIKAIYDRVYSVPTILIAIGRDMKKVLSEKTKSRSEIVYIPNWADADDVIPLKNSCAAIEKTRNVVFQFFGNLGRLQDIDNILDAIKLTKSKTASYEFIGHGSEVGTILDFIKNNPTVAIAHRPGVPFGSGNAILSECDVAIVSLATGMNGLGVPSKSYFSLAADKPLLVITDQCSELHQLIEEENSIGWYCEAANPQKLAQLIDEICSSNLSKLQGKPRAAMLNKYEHINAIEQYSKLISRLIN